MAFEKLLIQTKAPRTAAGLTITTTGKSTISLRGDIVAAAKLKPGQTFDALLGTGGDAGKLRLLAADGGGATSRALPRTGAFFISLGRVEAIGTTRTERIGTSARAIGIGGVEIDIPALPDAASEAEADNTDEAPAPAGAANGGHGSSNGAGETVNGVTIDLTDGAESVSFKGKSTEVTARQAKLVRLLARPRPQPVDESFLVAALWDGKPMLNATEQLKTIAADLRNSLAPIGLDLKAVKGVGYQLRDR